MLKKSLILGFLTITGFAVLLSQCAPFRKQAQAPARPNSTSIGSGLPSGNQLSYTKSPVNGPFIAITFDDGPHPSLTPRLLDMLRQRNIHATFYLVGNRVGEFASAARRIAADGHEIGNHTWTHPMAPSRWADAPLRTELQKTHDAIVNITGLAPRSYRPPGGSVNPHQKQWIFDEFGYPTILWAVDPNDWKRPGPAVVTQRILSATRPGYIVLAHDIHPGTIEAMPATLDGLLAKGYRFVTVSQLIGLGQARQASIEQPREWSISFSPGSF